MKIIGVLAVVSLAGFAAAADNNGKSSRAGGVPALEQQLAAAQQELAATQQQLTAAQQQLATVQQQYAAAQQQLSATQQQLTAAQQQLATVQQQYAAAQQQLSATQQQLTAAQQQASQLQIESAYWKAAYFAQTQACGAVAAINTPATAGFSCASLHLQGSAQDGVYWITAGATPFEAYCDMTTDGGGWTLAVGIDGANRNHDTAAAVAASALVSPGAKGKLSDATINALKSGVSPALRLSCEGSVAWFPPSCAFSAVGLPAGTCTTASDTFAPLAYSPVEVLNGEPLLGLVDGNLPVGVERTIYGAGESVNLNGCDAPNRHWAGNGALWVR